VNEEDPEHDRATKEEEEEEEEEEEGLFKEYQQITHSLSFVFFVFVFIIAGGETPHLPYCAAETVRCRPIEGQRPRHILKSPLYSVFV
jgi:hypothetical protein